MKKLLVSLLVISACGGPSYSFIGKRENGGNEQTKQAQNKRSTPLQNGTKVT